MKLEKTNVTGISIYDGKKGKVYYGSYRCPFTKKVIRKSIGLKSEIGTPKKALEKLYELKPKSQKQIDFQEKQGDFENHLNLNQLAKLYFENRIKKKKRHLREQFSNLNDKEFEEYPVVKEKLKNVGSKEENRFYKNIGSAKIAQIPVEAISKKDVKYYIEEVLSEMRDKRTGAYLTQKSKFNIVSQIKTIFNFAIKEEIISITNPFQNIKFKNPQRQRERVLNETEIADLLKECFTIFNYQPNVYLCVYLAVLTGGRSSTIRNIKKKDIDIKNKTISLYNFKATRQYKLRISQEAANWLKTKVLPKYAEDEFLIRSNIEANQKAPYKPMATLPKRIYSIMDYMFNSHLNKQDNNDRDKIVNFHTLRRSIATNLAKSGTSLYDVMVFLNHSNIDQTMRYLNMEHNTLHDNVNSLMETIFKDF